MPKLTWRNVLDYRHLNTRMYINSFAEYAKALGYPYFSWNDWIYRTDTGEQTEYKAQDVE